MANHNDDEHPDTRFVKRVSQEVLDFALKQARAYVPMASEDLVRRLAVASLNIASTMADPVGMHSKPKR